VVEGAGRSPPRRSHRTAHWRRKETLHFSWVTPDTGLPGRCGESTRDDQSCDREQAALLEPGSWRHENTLLPRRSLQRGNVNFTIFIIASTRGSIFTASQCSNGQHHRVRTLREQGHKASTCIKLLPDHRRLRRWTGSSLGFQSVAPVDYL
jgi:hypothetical protein